MALESVRWSVRWKAAKGDAKGDAKGTLHSSLGNGRTRNGDTSLGNDAHIETSPKVRVSLSLSLKALSSLSLSLSLEGAGLALGRGDLPRLFFLFRKLGDRLVAEPAVSSV